MGLKNREEGKGKKKAIIFVVSVCILLLLAGRMGYKALSGRRAEEAWAARLEQGEERRLRKGAEEEAAAAQSEQVLALPLESGINVLEAVKSRPGSVELTEGAEEGFVTVDSCLVDNKTSIISLKATAEGIPASDDDFYYLFANRIQNDEITEEMFPIQHVFKGENIEFRFSRHFGLIPGVLYKYVIAVKKDDSYVAVCKPCYVTNPEEISLYKSNGEEMPSKKGLLVDPDKLLSEELDELGIKHAAYNIPLSRILGESTSEEYPTIEYPYRGKGYSLNGEAISEYDLIFSTLTKKGIEITVILLNDVASSYPQMLHPLSRSGVGSAPYYAFNAADEEGIEYLGAISTFLAERYSGRANGRGVISNWVIGNEINARKDWNYMEYMGLETYVREYVKAFRVFYNSIKSINGAGKIYISLDHRWDSNNGAPDSYDAKDILDEFNKQIREGGNIDWGLAIHPYNVPLTSPYIWKESPYVKEDENTPMITMANIHVVTDYLEKKEFLTDEGEVRSVILSELGYTSSSGEEVQAAALVYAYKAAEANPHIDSVLFSRQTDAPEELAQGLALGLDGLDGSRKYAYQVFRYMDTEEEEKHTDFAKKIVGIGSWEEICPSP